MSTKWESWVNLGSDVNWEDHGGQWARKLSSGAWLILRFAKMPSESVEPDPYCCDVLYVNPREVPPAEVAMAKQFCGWDDMNPDFGASPPDHVLVEMLVSYGVYAPLETVCGKRAMNVRAQARRLADKYRRNAIELSAALDRVVNKIGTTAREFGRGDVDAGLRRYAEARVVNPDGVERDPGMDIMLKMNGVTDEVIEEARAKRDGQVTQFASGTITQYGQLQASTMLLVRMNLVPSNDPMAYAHGFMTGYDGREKPVVSKGEELATAWEEGFGLGQEVREGKRDIRELSHWVTVAPSAGPAKGLIDTDTGGGG